jgi:perosamine synthetase
MIKLCVPYITKDELKAVNDVLKSGWLTYGPKNEEYEEKFASYIGVKHAISCNSCASALFIVLKALEITGEVIIPSFSFVATANAVVTAGAIPRFVDIDYETCNIDVNKIEAAIKKNTQAIMPVHFGGLVCNMDPIMRIAQKHKLAIIEDSAETIGGLYKGKKSGSFGIGCFSFFPTKNITTGEGGMITTNDDSLANKMRALIGHGILSSTDSRTKEEAPWVRSASYAGYNYRMSNILAAIGVEQLKKIDDMNLKRRVNAQYLKYMLKNNPLIELPFEGKDYMHVYQMFTIKVKEKNNRNEVVKALNEQGIKASVHFDPPIHLHEYYKNHPEWGGNDLEVTEDVSKKIITLPMYPQLSKEQLGEIANVLNKILEIYG